MSLLFARVVHLHLVFMLHSHSSLFFFFFNDTATTEIYTLSLHDALPISGLAALEFDPATAVGLAGRALRLLPDNAPARKDRKSTRLNSSHSQISYAVFCLKKKKNNHSILPTTYYFTLTCVLSRSRDTRLE